ncbi:MAG TPA: tripartite tricarboxylate transporter substrate-binding protein [Micropepsaceae bacterium]|nr:tripartite tricarboxylate transporter substrate-binding protein [Micropepsaceae bacterium]
MPKHWRMLAAAIALLSPASAFAADSGMFKGKTITYIVATSPGGGYDTYGRLIARYLQKHLTGSRVIVKNVPGAGNIIGANEIYAARPDGLTMGMFNTGLIYDQLIHRDGVQFDLTKFSWIGKAASEGRALLISKASGIKSFDDMLKAKAPIKFAASGIGAASYNDTRILADALHLNVQIVNGFTGNEGEMSMLRGEVAAEVGTVDALEQFVKNGHGYFGLALSGRPDTLPGVPRAAAYIKDERGKRMLALLQALSEMGRLTAGPPGIPADVLAAERQALTTAVKDPQFLADAKKLNLPIDYLPGDAVESRIKSALAQPPETIETLKRVAGGG